MENQEYIIRLKDKTKDFTIVYNACFKDNTISMQAMGLFAYLMTLPNDWEIHKEELVSHFSNGRDAVFKAFDELVEKGYIVVEEIKGDKGQFGKKVYKVYEVSQGETKIVRKQRGKKECSDKEPVTDNHKRETVTGNPLTENPILLNTDNTKDLLPSTNNKSSSLQPNESSYKPFVPQEENSNSHSVSLADCNKKNKKQSEIKFKNSDYTLVYQAFLDNCKILVSQNKIDEVYEIPTFLKKNVKKLFVTYGVDKVLDAVKKSINNDWLIRETEYSPTAVFSEPVIYRLIHKISSPRSSQQPRQFDENHLFF